MTPACSLILGLLTTVLPGADWPEFRGAGANGIAQGRFPGQDGSFPPPDWTVPVPGQGWSSPVVRDGLLVLTAAVPDGESAKLWSFVVLGLDAANGKPRFRVTVFERPADSLPKIHSKNSHASPTPVLTNRGIVVHFGHVGTALVDFQGKVLWRTEGLYSKPVHGGGASPVVVGGKVLIPCDGLDLQALVALDLETGKESWRLDRKAGASKTFSFATPCPNGKNNGLVLSAASDILQQVDASTGKEIWRFPYTGYSVVPRPFQVTEDLAVLSTGYDKPKLLCVRLGELKPGQERLAWSIEKNAPLTPTPLMVDGRLLVLADNGVLSALEPETGKQLWQERLQGAYSASPILAGKQVLTVSETGKMTIFTAADKFSRVASFELKERSLASPALAGGWLYIRGEKGRSAWKMQAD